MPRSKRKYRQNTKQSYPKQLAKKYPQRERERERERDSTMEIKRTTVNNNWYSNKKSILYKRYIYCIYKYIYIYYNR